MRPDSIIKQDVYDILEWLPNIDETKITATVNNGIVKLTGTLDSYTKKIEVTNLIKVLYGVKAVVENIEIKYNINSRQNDTEIINAALTALNRNILKADNNINVKVENGWIYLNGDVKLGFEKSIAENTVMGLTDVRYVINNITVKDKKNAVSIIDKIKNNIKTFYGYLFQWYFHTS